MATITVVRDEGKQDSLIEDCLFNADEWISENVCVESGTVGIYECHMSMVWVRDFKNKTSVMAVYCYRDMTRKEAIKRAVRAGKKMQ